MYGIKLEVWGKYALFSRPEMKGERVSYDVITPSAARGILESVYWKPEITWIIDRLHILNTVRFENVRRNEVKHKASVGKIKKAMKDGTTTDIKIEKSRTQRSSLVLRDVHYVIEAHYKLKDEDASRHKAIFERRARRGQMFRQPVFGCREFPANFKLPENIPKSEIEGETDLGWMLWDIDFENDMKPLFFRAKMKDGIIEIPHRKEVLKC